MNKQDVIREYKNVSEQGAEARKRAALLEARGFHSAAAASKKAHEYCCQYLEKLQAIISAASTSRGTVMTKNANRRFLSSDHDKALNKWRKSR